ncbi:heme exporter protein CcmD [Corallincola platygyrae]|uniref:Heme exporter protein D n=1 Tax=Corallincola platygyrae TaxID=1193278 RepID=A0ABW4XIB3_9GAMM
MKPVIGECLPTGIHDVYIAASFGVSAAVLIGLVAWVVWSKRTLKKEIASRQARDKRRGQAQTMERAL